MKAFQVFLLLLSNGVNQALCRDLFSAPANQQPLQLSSLFGAEPLDDLPSDRYGRFYGLTTFAYGTFAACLYDDHVDTYDVAFLGAPFDTTAGLTYQKATTGRPGARFGPGGIRHASLLLQQPSWDIFTGKNPFGQSIKVIDCGDAPLTTLDNTYALAQLDEAHLKVSGRRSDAFKLPKIITLGGDHTTTLPALRSAHKRWGNISVIHFDSHIDTWDPAVLGGGISDYAGVNHGTFLHVAHEEGLIQDNSIHVGIRAPLTRRKGDIRNDKKCGFEIITAREIDHVGISGIVRQIRDRVGDGQVYISVDIDVLDPAFAPGTGTPEPGGWSTREMLSILDGLEGVNLIGADVVEVAPAYDGPGEPTALAAASIAISLLSLMVPLPE